MRSMELKIGDDHEQRVEVNEAENHGKIGIEQPFLGLIDDTRTDEGVVDQTVSSQKRDPGDHADHVRGPKGDGAEEEQRDLPGQRLDVKGQEIGDGETQHERDRTISSGISAGSESGGGL